VTSTENHEAATVVAAVTKGRETAGASGGTGRQRYLSPKGALSWYQCSQGCPHLGTSCVHPRTSSYPLFPRPPGDLLMSTFPEPTCGLAVSTFSKVSRELPSVCLLQDVYFPFHVHPSSPHCHYWTLQF
jgi:hypothetical protein